MRIGVKSDKGMSRETNEDSVHVIAGNDDLPVAFIIADGMGGHNSGDIASKLAVAGAVEYIKNNLCLFNDESQVQNSLLNLVNSANNLVYTNSLENEAYFGMGTTLIAAILLNNFLYIAHVGDSRVYRVRNGEIERITTDHSYIEELVKNGSITREQAGRHPKKNIITKAVGCPEDIEADIYSCEVIENDTYIFCTDGLTNMLGEEEIKNISIIYDDVEDACNELVRRANEEGGEDNVTVILFKNCK